MNVDPDDLGRLLSVFLNSLQQEGVGQLYISPAFHVVKTRYQPITSMAEGEAAVQVAVRVRPFNGREKAMNAQRAIDMEDNVTLIYEHGKDF